MRHRKSGTKLGRTSSHRNAMLRNMVTSLLKHERIHTTDTKAKVLRGWADHVITLARRGDLHARRQVMAIVREESVVHKLFAEAKERFQTSNGGYTRIVKLGNRPGDAASMSLIELVAAGSETVKKSAPKKEKKASVKVPATSGEADAREDEKAVVEASAAEVAPVEPETEAAENTGQEKKE